MGEGPVKLGTSVPVTYTITNIGKSQVTIPTSINSADIEPADPSTGYKFRELQIGVSAGPPPTATTTGGTEISLGPAPDLYGDPSIPGTTHVLKPGQSAAIRAELPIRPFSPGLQLAPGPHKLTAFAFLSLVRVLPRGSGLVQSGTVVATARSRPTTVDILPHD